VQVISSWDVSACVLECFNYSYAANFNVEYKVPLRKRQNKIYYLSISD